MQRAKQELCIFIYNYFRKGRRESLLECNVFEALICYLVYLFIVFGEHGRYIGNINHLW